MAPKERTMDQLNLITPASCPLCYVPARLDGRRNRRTIWTCPVCKMRFETTELLEAKSGDTARARDVVDDRDM
jgi:ribosomal protein L37AE/L43A